MIINTLFMYQLAINFFRDLDSISVNLCPLLQTYLNGSTCCQCGIPPTGWDPIVQTMPNSE